MSFNRTTTIIQLHNQKSFYYYFYFYSYQDAVDATARALVLTETSFPFTAEGKSFNSKHGIPQNLFNIQNIVGRTMWAVGGWFLEQISQKIK